MTARRRAITVRLTHKGWFLFAPVYIAGIDSDAPIVEPRHRALDWLLRLAGACATAGINLRSSLDADYEPCFRLIITGRLPRPLERVIDPADD